MMAGIENHNREQPRVEKAVIVHAGEDLDTIIRPLASILEQRLKLAEQAEYKRIFRQDVADHVLSMLSEFPEENTRLVVVVSETFVANCATNVTAFQQIKQKLLGKPASDSKFAVVYPSSLPPQLAGLRAINMGIFVRDIEGGNLAEAIFREWFGPQASLTSQAELSMQNPPRPATEFILDKVKIIHAMVRQEDRQKFWGKIGSAIEDVANPENTTQARLHFRQTTVAQTVLSDFEGFKKCAEIKRIKAVVLWCPSMLTALGQDTAAKTKIIEMLCNDTGRQKLFVHFLFGVDRQQMQRFSQDFWLFLSVNKHMAYIEAAHLHVLAPNVDYRPYAHIFLRHWSGSGREPEESADPTMTSLEDLSHASPGSTWHKSQPQQDRRSAEHLVISGASLDLDAGEAHRTQQMGKALRSADSSGGQHRLLADGESWHLGLVASASKSREAQSDGFSNPPRQWGESVPGGEPGTSRGPRTGPVQQPVPGSVGQNRLANGSMGSVSVDSEFGPKRADATKQQVPVSGPQGLGSRGAVSLSPGSVSGHRARDQPLTTQPHQPVSATESVNNKAAPSRFQSQTIDSLRSNASSSTTCQQAAAGNSLSLVGEGSAAGNISSGTSEPAARRGDCQQSLQANGASLSSEAAQQLDWEMSMCNSLGFLSNNGNQIVRGEDRASIMTSNRQSFPSVGQQSLADQDTASVMTTSVSLPDMSTASSISSTDLPSVAERAQPIPNGESGSSSGPAESGQGNPGQTPLSDLPKPIIRGLELRLDPIKTSISDWRDLASYFKVPSELIGYWKGTMSAHGNCSPTESLLEWLKAERKAVSVGDLKAALQEIIRFDVLKYLTEKGY